MKTRVPAWPKLYHLWTYPQPGSAPESQFASKRLTRSGSPVAGKERWLVVSANRAILQTEAERQLWIDNQVGGVFLASGRVRAVDVLRLMLRRLSWLEHIDRTETRPFAFILPVAGQPKRAREIPVP